MGVDPVTASLIATTVGGAIGANDLKQKEKGRAGALKKLYAGMDKNTRELFEKALRASGGGYDAAQKHLQGAGATAKRGLSVAGKQNAAAATEGAISRGLYGSSYLNSLRGAISGNTARGRAAIDEGTATMIANLLQGKGAAQAGLFTGQASALNQIGLSNAAGLWGQQFQPGATPDFTQLLKLGMGGMGGGGGGASWQGIPGPGSPYQGPVWED